MRRLLNKGLPRLTNRRSFFPDVGYTHRCINLLILFGFRITASRLAVEAKQLSVHFYKPYRYLLVTPGLSAGAKERGKERETLEEEEEMFENCHTVKGLGLFVGTHSAARGWSNQRNWDE